MGSILTSQAHTMLLKYLYNESSMWVGIGRTTPWDDENAPPVPDPTATEVEEIVGYKVYSEKYMVKEDPNGELIFNGKHYKIVSDPDTELPNLLYIRFDLEPTDLPIVDYRQFGLFFGLTALPGYASNTSLLPDEVDSTGMLMAIDNRKVIHRSEDSREVIKFLLRT